MKITLLITNTWPAGGWQFLQPEIPYVNPNPMASLESIAKQLVLIRSRNPRHGLSTDFETARDDILAYNYHRLGPEQRAKFFLTGDQAAEVKKNSPSSLSRRVVEAVGTVKQLVVGSKTLIEAFGGDGRPVAQALADKRAAVCLECPLNVDKGVTVTARIAEHFKDFLEAKNELKLHAKGEQGLHICDACGCHLPLKAWTPLPHIVANLPAADFDKLHFQCWVRAEKKTLTLVMPFCGKDIEDLKLLLCWMRELGGLEERRCLMVADCKVPENDLAAVVKQAKLIFGSVELLKTPYALLDERWPLGANWLWLTAAKHMQQAGHSWFWCEADCVPLRRGWLDEIEQAYLKCHKPFMGCFVNRNPKSSPDLPAVHMNGIAVYPADAFARIGHKVSTKTLGLCAAFDLITHDLVVPEAVHTPMIHHFWGEINTPPVFVGRLSKNDPVNALPLSFIRKEAVVFHRSKSGSLIRLLQSEVPLTVVITSFERPEHLKKAFDSCLVAGVKNIVIAFSGSMDRMSGVANYIGETSPSTVQVISRGTSNQSWLQGVEAAQTEYVSLLHDDDLLLLGYHRMVAPALRAKAPFVVVQAGSHGVPNYITKESDKEGMESSSVLRGRLEQKGALAISPIRGVFRKVDLVQWLKECEAMPKSCYLRPGFLVGNDLVIWLKATDKYPEFWNVPKPGVSFGHWEGSTTVAELPKRERTLFKIYDEARRWYQASKHAASPLHIVTIVLDGMPFIARHLDVFSKLAIQWHWHVVEGAASNTHCTRWCKPQKARLSRDGTTAYLDQIAKHPNVSLYRKPLWDGKVEMVNAPLGNIKDECVLLEVDCDEFWKTEQIESLVRLFDSDQTRTHAMFWCRYFFGPHLVMTSRNCYANNPVQDWKRAWRFKPGDKFLSHEPPNLSSEGFPFMHKDTEAAGLVFDHYGYAQRSQVEFKESFYGYKGAVKQWEKLQQVKSGEAKLSDYLTWVRPEQSGMVTAIT